MRWTKGIASAVVAVGLIASSSAIAQSSIRPTHLVGGQHSCSYTSTEYMAANNNMSTYLKPGSTYAKAIWTPGHRPWEDFYWITGAHDEWSSICNSREIPGSHGKHGKSLLLPAKVNYPAIITARMVAHGDGRIGFDLWFTASRKETTPTEMEHDKRTWEVLVMPGNGHYIFRDNPGWHRVYFGVLHREDGIVSFRNFSLTKVAKELHVPGNLYWMTIGAGAETDFGEFYVDSYALQAEFMTVGTPSPPFRSYHPKRKHHRPVYTINPHPITGPGYHEGDVNGKAAA